MNDYAIFSMILLLPFLPFPIKQVTIYTNKLKLTEWFLGFIPFSSIFSKELGRKTIMSIEEYKVEPNAIETGTFLDIFLLFFPRKKFKVRYLLVYLKGERKLQRSINLTDEELKIISNFSILIQHENKLEETTNSNTTIDYSDLQ